MRISARVAVSILACAIGAAGCGAVQKLEKRATGCVLSGDPAEELSVSPGGRWFASVASGRADPVALFDVSRGTRLRVLYTGAPPDFSFTNGCASAWQNDHTLVAVFSLGGQSLVYEVGINGGDATATPLQVDDPKNYFSNLHKRMFGTTIRAPAETAGLSDSPLRNGAFGITAKESDNGRSLYVFFQDRKIGTYLQTTGLLNFSKPILGSVSAPVFVQEPWRWPKQKIRGFFYTVAWVSAGLQRTSTDLYYFNVKDWQATLVEKDVAELSMWSPDACTFFYAKKDAQGAFQLIAVFFKHPQGEAAPKLY